MGGKTLPEIRFGLYPSGIFMPEIQGRLLHGWQNLARVSVQTFARWGMTSPEIRADFTPVGCLIPEKNLKNTLNLQYSEEKIRNLQNSL